jgi:predicted ferric reductase
VLALLFVANVGVFVALWLGGGGVQDIHDSATFLVGLGRISGLLGAYLVLVELLLIGVSLRTRWHAWNGRVCLALLVAHAVLVTWGYTIGDRISLPAEIGRLWSGYPGVITATAGLVILIAVVATSVVAVRRRMRYETWYFIHLYAYLGVALAFSHQLATGTDFVGDATARAYWTALYVATLAAIVIFRLGLPLARSVRHDLRVARVLEEGPEVTSIEIEGRGLSG